MSGFRCATRVALGKAQIRCLVIHCVTMVKNIRRRLGDCLRNVLIRRLVSMPVEMLMTESVVERFGSWLAC